MKTILYSDKYEIVDNNTVMPFNKSSNLIIEIDAQNNFKFSIELIFEDDVTNNIVINRAPEKDTEKYTSLTEIY